MNLKVFPCNYSVHPAFDLFCCCYSYESLQAYIMGLWYCIGAVLYFNFTFCTGCPDNDFLDYP